MQEQGAGDNREKVSARKGIEDREEHSVVVHVETADSGINIDSVRVEIAENIEGRSPTEDGQKEEAPVEKGQASGGTFIHLEQYIEVETGGHEQPRMRKQQQISNSHNGMSKRSSRLVPFEGKLGSPMPPQDTEDPQAKQDSVRQKEFTTSRAWRDSLAMERGTDNELFSTALVQGTSKYASPSAARLGHLSGAKPVLDRPLEVILPERKASGPHDPSKEDKEEPLRTAVTSRAVPHSSRERKQAGITSNLPLLHSPGGSAILQDNSVSSAWTGLQGPVLPELLHAQPDSKHSHPWPLSFDHALTEGTLCPRTGQVIDRDCSSILSLMGALQHGLLDPDSFLVKNTIGKTVLTIEDAVREGILNPETGTVLVATDCERVSFEDALARRIFVTPQTPLSLVEALEYGLYRPSEGRVLCPFTGRWLSAEEYLPLAPWIDLPGTLVRDVGSGRWLTLDEATREGLLDLRLGQLLDRKTGCKMGIKEAREMGLFCSAEDRVRRCVLWDECDWSGYWLYEVRKDGAHGWALPCLAIVVEFAHGDHNRSACRVRWSCDEHLISHTS